MLPELHVIVASTRPGRHGTAVAQWFSDYAEADGGFEVRLVDLAEIALPFLDEPHSPRLRRYVHEHTLSWSTAIDGADAFVFVMPEYNHGIVAPLKNALDYLFHEWNDKPVGFVSYGGAQAGARAVEMCIPIVTALRMHPVIDTVCIPVIAEHVVDGKFTSDKRFDMAAQGLLDELRRVDEALRPLRAAPLAT